ncbi:uncharacterized protein TNCV_4066781 [Trichonephila clavipes]|uniref:Uncharacterized protein n=1 Tax=Trichonephila clavipes TaxID=2585209 RepID=A0A8X6W8P3_TRICX|nr:uncharacterized protein TNCV_4066781 [Trichonephila clavipes]
MFQNSFQPNTCNFFHGLLIRQLCRLLKMWADMVGRRFARDSCPTASKDQLWLRLQAIRNSSPQADIQHMFESIPCRMAALIAESGGNTKY